MKNFLTKANKEFGGAIFVLFFLLPFILFGFKNVIFISLSYSIILFGYELYKLNRDHVTTYLSFFYPLSFFVLSLILLFFEKLFN